MSQDAYTRAGVSQSGADAAVAALVAQLAKIDTGKPSRVVPLPGHYASVLRLDERTGIAFGTDGVGTKMVVAEQLGRFETIGIDCIAMNVNDLICVGAEPIALVDFILCPTADPEQCGAIGEGLRRGAELAGIEIPGGEIAQVGDVVNGLELAGSAIGLVPLDGIVTGASIAPGDASSASPPRACTRTATRSPARPSPTSRSTTSASAGPLGEILLEPTEIYVRPILELLGSAVDVRGLAHITGDGLNNLLRLGAGVGYEIDDPLPAQPIFGLIAELGGIDDERDARGLQHGLRLLRDRSRARTSTPPSRCSAPTTPRRKRIGRVTDRAGTVTRAVGDIRRSRRFRRRSTQACCRNDPHAAAPMAAIQNTRG